MPWRRKYPLSKKFLRGPCSVGRHVAFMLVVFLLLFPARAIYGQCALGRMGSDHKDLWRDSRR